MTPSQVVPLMWAYGLQVRGQQKRGGCLRVGGRGRIPRCSCFPPCRRLTAPSAPDPAPTLNLEYPKPQGHYHKGLMSKAEAMLEDPKIVDSLTADELHTLIDACNNLGLHGPGISAAASRLVGAAREGGVRRFEQRQQRQAPTKPGDGCQPRD